MSRTQNNFHCGPLHRGMMAAVKASVPTRHRWMQKLGTQGRESLTTFHKK